MKDQIEWINISDELLYDGSQLSYDWVTSHSDSPNSIISFSGPCDIKKKFMVDLEDLKNDCLIQSDNMLHFIIKHNSFSFPHIVFMQRLFISIIKEVLENMCPVTFLRSGDDIYVNSNKLNISVATIDKKETSGLVHAAVNITSHGTPSDIDTISLDELNISAGSLRDAVVNKYTDEWKDILYSAKKVKHV